MSSSCFQLCSGTSVVPLPAVRVISLVSSPRRVRFLAKNLHTLEGFDVSFLDAINGFEVGPHGLDVLDELAATKFKRGAIGCALSHREAWRECVEANQPRLILEDDAVVHPAFGSLFQQLVAQLPVDWDILQLSVNLDVATVIEAIPGAVVLHCKPQPSSLTAAVFLESPAPASVSLHRLLVAFGTSGYLVSPAGAAKLLAQVFPLQYLAVPHVSVMSRTLDGVLSRLYPTLSAWVCLTPLITTEKGTPEYQSTIR